MSANDPTRAARRVNPDEPVRLEEEMLVDDPLFGRVVDGRYTVLSELGRGGMGAVYRAHQASLERQVALKVLLATKGEREAEFQRRFFLEAATAAKLKHPNTITVFDYGSDEVAGRKIFFIAMELLEGRTLTQALRGEAFPISRVADVSLQMCRSLREAHRAGVVHRDLKPGNIMLLEHGDEEGVEQDFVKVLDFGLAKTFERENEEKELTRAGTFLGSPRYVSPEQIEGKNVDGRADIYSLGCVMYRMLSGRVPFDGSTAMGVMLKHLQEDPEPLNVPGVPVGFERLVLDCLAKKRDDRPSTMDEVITRLKLIRAEVMGRPIDMVSLSDEGRESRSYPRAPAASTPPTPAGNASPDMTLSDSRDLSSELSPADANENKQVEVLDFDSVSIEDHRPDKTFGRSRERSRRMVLLSGFIFGLIPALAVVLGMSYGWDAKIRDFMVDKGWLEGKPTAPAPSDAPVTGSGPVAPRTIEVRASAAPNADVYEALQGGETKHGKTPLSIDWRVTDAAATRTLVFKRPGYADKEVTLNAPAADEGKAKQILDVEVKLRKR